MLWFDSAMSIPSKDTVVTVEYLDSKLKKYYNEHDFWHFLTREVHGDKGDYAGFVPNPKFEEFKAKQTDFEKRMAEKIEVLQQENRHLKAEVEAIKNSQKSQFSVLWACLKPSS